MSSCSFVSAEYAYLSAWKWSRKVLNASKTAVYNAMHPSHLSQLCSHFNIPKLA
jgi:hypothetical protein